jgi:ABC-type Na+ transport system ATPase subunit NatA
MALKVQDLNKIYPPADGNPANHAVKNISFGVNHAMCHGILGHNGAGI